MSKFAQLGVQNYVLYVINSRDDFLAEGFYPSGVSQNLKSLSLLIFIIKKSPKAFERK